MNVNTIKKQESAYKTHLVKKILEKSMQGHEV